MCFYPTITDRSGDGRINRLLVNFSTSSLPQLSWCRSSSGDPTPGQTTSGTESKDFNFSSIQQIKKEFKQ